MPPTRPMAAPSSGLQPWAARPSKPDPTIPAQVVPGSEAATCDVLTRRAHHAQRIFQDWSDDRVDALLGDIAGAVSAASRLLAAETVAETGIGDVADKTQKNHFASLAVYQHLAGQVAAGVISRDPVTRITEIATPVGVVLGVFPVTNPVATLIFTTLISLKGRNALIASPHHAATAVSAHTSRVIRQVLARCGAPVDLLQCAPPSAGRSLVEQLMRSPAVSLVLATGGPEVVRAAYSSGTPAIGVGAGNAPAWVCADADLDVTAATIVASKSFDHGVVCGSEQHIIVDRHVGQRFQALLTRAGAAVLTEEQCRKLAATLFDAKTGAVRRQLVGRSPSELARAAEIALPPATRLLVVPLDAAQQPGPWTGERLAPVVTLVEAGDDNDAVNLCQAHLANQGQGHTASIHTTDPRRVEWFALRVPVSRLIVNGPAAQGCIGLGTGLPPSFTLGCGTGGGTSTSDNIGYRHLLNIRRIVEQTADPLSRRP